MSIIKDIKEGLTMKEISEKHEAYYTRYSRSIEKLYEMHKPKEEYDVETEDGDMYDWQRDLIDYIEGKPDKRKIHIVLDTVGNTGKSTICKHILANYDAIMLSGKGSDMKHAYNGQRVVLIDVPRTAHDYLSYGAIEEIKNGVIFSPKYDSKMKVYKDNPHVIIFTNIKLDAYAWSSDRYEYVSATRSRVKYVE